MSITGNKVVLNLSGSDNMRHVEPGDFISHLRSFQGGLEYSRLRGKVSAAYTVLTPRKEIVGEYFRYLFKSVTYIQALQTTTDQLRDGQSIRFGQFSRIELISPPLDEQRQIAEYLDRETGQIEALITKQEQLVETLTERRQAVITHAVTRGLNPNVNLTETGLIGVGEAPLHWKWRTLKSMSTQISKGTTPSTIGADYTDQGIRFLRGEDLVAGAIQSDKPLFVSEETNALLRRSQLQLGDILFVIAGTLGKTAVVIPEVLPANTNQAISFVRLRSPEGAAFIHYWLSSNTVRDMTALMAVTAAQPNLSMENLGNFVVPVPPAAEREAIVKSLDGEVAKIDELTLKAHQIVEVLKERRQALISAAVTGKIDVRGL